MKDKTYGWPTARRYPRTLLEAFPNSVENAQWWFPPEKNRSFANIALWTIAALMWIGLAYYFANL